MSKKNKYKNKNNLNFNNILLILFALTQQKIKKLNLKFTNLIGLLTQ
jgi:hypothetical protein